MTPESPGASASPPPWVLMGQALRAAWEGRHEEGEGAETDAEAMEVRSDADETDRLPLDWLLRRPEELPGLERRALELARGRVLDVGAGGGAHALPLQAAGHRVTALERSADAAWVLRARGVTDVRVGDVLDEGGWARGQRWDTVLLLMNGTTLVGSFPGLVRLFRALEPRLAAGGTVLVDSVDLRKGGEDRRADGRYVGEVQLQLAWRGRRTEPFPVLYADPDLLGRAAGEAGLSSRVVDREEETGAWLGELARR